MNKIPLATAAFALVAAAAPLYAQRATTKEPAYRELEGPQPQSHNWR
jgi:hypothetical protein